MCKNKLTFDQILKHHRLTNLLHTPHSCHKPPKAKLWVNSALNKSCHHQIGPSFDKHMIRLCNYGCPTGLLETVCEFIWANMTNKKTRIEQMEGSWQDCGHSIHTCGISQKLKNIAKKQDVPAVTSAPYNTYAMCRNFNDGNVQVKICDTTHQAKYAPCTTGVVFQISLSTGKYYIGQTGRCINDRIREHLASLKGTSAGHLSARCKTCECTRTF